MSWVLPLRRWFTRCWRASWRCRSWGLGWLIWLRLVLDLRGIMVLIGIGIVRIGVVSVTVSPEVAVVPAVSFSTVSLGPLTAAAPQRSPAVPCHCGSRIPGVQLGFVFGETAAGLAWY